MNSRLSLLSTIVVFQLLALASAGVSARGVIFEQPRLDEAAPHAYVVSKPRKGSFYLVLWQKNPHEHDGRLIPVTWRVGDKTGFYPSRPLERHQLGMRNIFSSTALQIEGDTVGAYLNSADLGRAIDGKESKEMVAPAYEFPALMQQALLAGDNSAFACSLQLQVPTASDHGGPKSRAYVNLNLLFAKNNGNVRLSFNGGLFANGRGDYSERLGYDPVTRNVLVLTPILPTSKWSAYNVDSEIRQSLPWRGWKTFQFRLTRETFASALKAAKDKHPEISWGSDPAEWKLVQIHLNAEIHYETGAAELGWSMRLLKCVTS